MDNSQQLIDLNAKLQALGFATEFIDQRFIVLSNIRDCSPHVKPFVDAVGAQRLIDHCEGYSVIASDLGSIAIEAICTSGN